MKLKYNKILMTGSSGFIGYHLAKELLNNDIDVIGVDNENKYYDNTIKIKRNQELKKYKNYKFIKKDISKKKIIKDLRNEDFDLIINLAAYAGVRYSLKNPFIYIKVNVDGFVNIMELARKKDIRKVIYASSSSVYGGNKKYPSSEKDKVDKPVSLYAATKKSNELIAHVYSHLFNIKTIGLRFFTVYGEFGRPDMALYIFIKNILKNKPIELFNYGNQERDFTYVKDIVDGIINSINYEEKYDIFNLGNSKTVHLKYFVELIEKNLKKKAKIKLLPPQPGDVNKSYADITHAKEKINYNPKTSIEDGIKKTVKWYLQNKDWLLKMK